jgi:hypothetical protein
VALGASETIRAGASLSGVGADVPGAVRPSASLPGACDPGASAGFIPVLTSGVDKCVADGFGTEGNERSRTSI